VGLGESESVPAFDAEEDQRDFLSEESVPVEVPVPPPLNVMVIEADPTPFWIAVPGLIVLSAILLVYSGISARQTEINYGD
jgi:hypothetical protein